MVERSITPSRKWYLLAAALVAGGIIVVLWGTFGFVSAMRSALGQEVLVPGSGEVILDKPGTYNVLHEYEAVAEGRLRSEPPGVPGLKVMLRDAGGCEVPLRASNDLSDISIGQRKARVLWEFSVSSGGRYVLEGRYDRGEIGPKAVLTVGSEIGPKVVPFVIAIVGCVLSLFGATAISIAVPWLRARNRRKSIAV